MAADRLWSQLAAAVVMSMTPIVYGITLSYAGLLLAESQAADGAAQLSLTDATLVASISNLGRMVACVVSAQLTDRLGVLRVIQLSTPLNLLAWPLMTLGSKSMMLAGAILAGAVVGLTGFTSRLYIAEVTTNRYRPVLCYLPGVAIGLGLLTNYSLSSVIPWRYATLLCGCTPSLVHIVGTILLPNSPRWLANREAPDEAVQKSIVFYRGKQADITGEMTHIQLSVKGRSNRNILRQVHLIFTDWDVGKPCLLMVVQFFFETFCGGVVLAQYALSVFQMAVTTLEPAQCTQLLAVLQVVAVAVSAWLLCHWGRRTVLTGAGVLCGLGQLIVAAYFYFQASLSGHTWLVMVGIVLANAASMGGISQLSQLYIGETLPTNVRQMFGCFISLYKGALSMAFIFLFPVLRTALGPEGLFGVLAGVNLLQVVFARCLLPETRGLTLEEVQLRHFSTKRRQREATLRRNGEIAGDGEEGENGTEQRRETNGEKEEQRDSGNTTDVKECNEVYATEVQTGHQNATSDKPEVQEVIR